MSFRNRVKNSRAWTVVHIAKAISFERSYRRRRDAYAALLERRQLQYSEATSISEVRARLLQRGYRPRVKNVGAIRTLAIIGEVSWHASLLNSLLELGPVVNCDYARFQLAEWDLGRLAWRRAQFNAHVLDVLREENKCEPFDWVFAYVNGRYILRQTLETIHEEFGIPTVNMWLDDKNRWSTVQIDGQDCGQIDLAAAFDLSWTSSRIACGWYIVEGGRPIYMPEGCDAAEFHRTTAEYEIPVSFVGSCYGCRPGIIRHWKRHGLPIRVFGSDWGTMGEYAASLVDVFSRSQINMGIGGMGDSELLTNVKGRDFEVACTGGGAYLTTYNAELACAFDVGKEILCYGSRDEAIDIAQYYLHRPDECRAIATRARERCLREHLWRHRLLHLCDILGITCNALTS